ncbi:MAG: restriction endonuclease [Clostridiales bacterium GWF2_38_85]|nr:MAG: restriction endonuclease [Clostridiales bacterium GWF2_38_85]
MSMWLCRAGRYGEYENKFLEENRIYCTWNNLPEAITKFPTKHDLQQYFVDNDPDTKVKTAMNWASQVWPFGNEMKKGEIVVLPSKINPVIHFGKILGDYEYLPDNENPYYHSRKVEWISLNIPRTKFEQDILFSFGAFMTICRIKQEDRIMTVVKAFQHGKKAAVTIPELPTENEPENRDIEMDAIEDISNLMIRKTKGHGLAQIIDGILRAKGFTTYISPAGPDKGVDILASSGVLGFGGQKICVQVKSSDTPIDRIVLDQLGGVMKNFNADYGLLVSWSGFKTSVINETAKQFFDIRLWTHKEIIEEFLKYYDVMGDDIKELIPLKKIWVVNSIDE